MPLWLLALLFTAFVVHTDDHVIAGLLPEIAADLGVSEAAAGQLVTVFSLTVVAGAPTAAVVTATWPRRLLFAGALTVFVAANAAAAAVPSYGALLALRVLAAASAAAVTPALVATAAALAPEGRRGRSIGAVSLGIAGAITLGVPLGIWIGGHLGWHATFAAMAAVGALALVWLVAVLPEAEPAPPTPLREQVRVLSSGPISLGLLGNLCVTTGAMLLLVYLAPYLAAVADVGTTVRGVLFAAAGAAGAAGVWLGGRATDRWGPDPTLRCGIGVFVALMAVLTVLWPLRPVPLWLVGPAAVVWGASVFFTSPAITARLLHLAGPVGTQALAVNAGVVHLGAAVGGAVGGVLLAATTIATLPPAAGVLCSAGLALFALGARAARPGTTQRSAPAS